MKARSPFICGLVLVLAAWAVPAHAGLLDSIRCGVGWFRAAIAGNARGPESAPVLIGPPAPISAPAPAEVPAVANAASRARSATDAAPSAKRLDRQDRRQANADRRRVAQAAEQEQRRAQRRAASEAEAKRQAAAREAQAQAEAAQRAANEKRLQQQRVAAQNQALTPQQFAAGMQERFGPKPAGVDADATAERARTDALWEEWLSEGSRRTQRPQDWLEIGRTPADEIIYVAEGGERGGLGTILGQHRAEFESVIGFKTPYSEKEFRAKVANLLRAAACEGIEPNERRPANRSEEEGEPERVGRTGTYQVYYRGKTRRFRIRVNQSGGIVEAEPVP